jgi:hypothetical protein
MPSPTEAIEQADIFLSQRESNRVERVAKEVLQEQQRGVYFHRPRQVSEVDSETGEEIAIVVFDIHKASDNSLTDVRGKRNVFEAWTDVIRSRQPDMVNLPIPVKER